MSHRKNLFFAALLLLLAGGCRDARSISIPIGDVPGSDGQSGARILWEQFADGQTVASGEAASGTDVLKLRPETVSGIYENHILLTFLRADGSEIARKSLEIPAPDRYQPVNLGDFFDPLAILSGIRPVLLSGPDGTEAGMMDEEILVTEDRSTDVVEKYYSKSRYSNDAGSFLYEQEFSLSPTAIHADYTITPENGSGQASAYGIAYRPRGLKGLRYVGPGPQDDAAFGLWAYDSGVKTARSVLLDLWQGTMRIDGGRYLKVDPSSPGEVMILGDVFNGSGGGPDAPFSGSFTITLR